MANIFLAPRSNETSHENFESTIIGGRTYEFLEPYLNDDEKRELSEYPVVSVWGNKESLRSRWEKMQSNDYVLFYAKGAFYYSAQVIRTKHSPELGRVLWPSDEDGEPWSCLFFVKNLQEINIPIKVVQELAEYEPSWDRVQGFMRLNDGGTAAIVNKFGSIAAFVGQKPEVYEVIENIIEISRDENLQEEKIEDIDKEEILREALAFTPSTESHAIATTPHKIRIENRIQKRRIALLEDCSCQICGWSLEWRNAKGKQVFRIDVDHILDKAKGGGEESENLWALCPNCHVKKTLGVITVDLVKKEVKENDKLISLHHDNRKLFRI